MKKNTRLYMRANNHYAWVMALFMVGSAVARVLIVGGKGTDLWSQIILPVAAAVLFVAIAFIGGKRHFYRTAIPVWMMMFYYFFVITCDFECLDHDIRSVVTYSTR